MADRDRNVLLFVVLCAEKEGVKRELQNNNLLESWNRICFSLHLFFGTKNYSFFPLPNTVLQMNRFVKWDPSGE